MTGHSQSAKGLARLRSTPRPTLTSGVWLIGLILAVTWPHLVGSSYLVDVGTIALTYMVTGQSLNLVYGYAGYLCMSIPVFWASGGFVAAHLVSINHMGALLAILIGGAAGAGIALLFGMLALRRGRDSFALLSLILLVAGQLIANSWSFTGGAQGIAALPVVQVGPASWHLVISSDQDFYYAMLVIAGAALLTMFLLISSRWGRTLRATNVDEALASSFGINLFRERLRALTLAGGFCGLAGAMYVFSLTIADPSQIAPAMLTPLFAIVFLGGPGSFTGVTIAAIAVAFLPQWTRSFQSDSNLVYGVLLVGLCLLFPKGLPETLADLWRNLKARRTSHGPEAPETTLDAEVAETVS